jgi:hypothetical protein
MSCSKQLGLRLHLVGLPLLGPPLQFSIPSTAIYNLLKSAHIPGQGERHIEVGGLRSHFVELNKALNQL